MALSCQKKRTKSEIFESVLVPENRSVSQIQSEISHADHTKWNNIIKSSNSSDSWNEIAWKGHKDDFHSLTPSAKDFGEYFISKSTIEGEQPFSTCDLENANYCPVLDDPISMEEIIASEKRLKEGKSTGDGWTHRMLTSVSVLLYPSLAPRPTLFIH